jgi:glycosyltransferase involved in cell wall biosynthesis
MLNESHSTPVISIVVATLNRKVALARFLEALRRLPIVPKWELVIADNGSIDGSADLLDAAARNFPLTRIYEPQRGKSRALNAAVSVAKGDLLVFCDDDVVPSRNWLIALYEASLKNPKVNVFGGRVVVQRAKMPPWIVESYNLHAVLLSEQNLGDIPFLFPNNWYPVGPNLAVRRSRLEQTGASWPAKLGPGTRVPVGDECAFLSQLSAPSDHDRLYVPTSVVMHSIDGRELSFGKCLARCFLAGFAAGMILRDFGSPCRQDGAGKRALQRLRQCSSFWELGCIFTRALGVLIGGGSWFRRYLKSSTGVQRDGLLHTSPQFRFKSNLRES